MAVLLFSCITQEGKVAGETAGRDGDEYKPTEELYASTFDEVDSLINELNSIIRNRDYPAWLQATSEAYRKERSDPEFLSELSKQPALCAKQIKLKSLKDYFEYVIVPSRAISKLERIVFLNENRVKALSTLYGNTVILYNLVRVDGKWKIGISK